MEAPPSLRGSSYGGDEHGRSKGGREGGEKGRGKESSWGCKSRRNNDNSSERRATERTSLALFPKPDSSPELVCPSPPLPSLALCA